MASPSPENKDKKPENPSRPSGKQPSDEEAPRSSSFGPWLLILIVLFVVVIWMYMKNPANQGSSVKYSFFLEQLSKDKIESVTFHGDILTGTWKDIPENPEEGGSDLSETFNVRLPRSVVEGDQLLDELLAKDTNGKRKYEIEIDSEDTGGGMGTQIFMWLLIPLLLLGFFLPLC